ncbi:MAG: phenylalanine--tRNA ligase subunit beta, partial [Waddliaceae bacterium]|nr:phenylalanine--tRNA ligase subunit beta [Waddliaceae bacterium]
MKVPLSWLKKYVEIDKTPEDIADILTMAGLEVDAIEEYLPGFSGVVVAEVLDTTSHPDADNLCIARVFDGSEEYSVVCGASNCRKGLRVAFAAIGAVLAGPDNKAFKIKKSKIRGVESMGMLCSEEELSLADSAEGIMELPKEFSVGENLGEELGDTIFDISLTPNLGHCLSIIGVAREVAALTGKSIKHPEYSFVEASEGAIVDDASVIVEDAGLCPRYCCRVIKGVKVGPSPLWLQNKLVHCGFKSINNIVDATNYVLMEYGHPLHAFDYHNLSGGAIIVKTANEGDKFVTLDGEECILHEGALMICDGKDPVAIAGVMGGENSAVSADTVDLLIESAYFCPKTVRKTSRLLGIATESSKRFERGIDPNNVPVALERVTALIVEVAGGDVVPGIIDAKESPFVEAVIPCRVSRINKLLGTKLAVSEIQTIFDSLQFSTTWDGVDTFDVAVPTYRNDITAEIDLVEEVARIYGY